MTRLEVDTPRFGPLTVEPDAVWEFPHGVIGLAECRRFVRLPFAEPELPFEWLQSLDDVAVAFLLADPKSFFPDYSVVVPPDQLDAIALTTETDGEIRCIVTVTAAVADMTANLLGPIVLNQPRRLGMQVALADPQYATKHRLFPDAAHAGSHPSA